MSDRETYREWAQSVRSEARRSLQALREERLARRRPRSAAPSEQQSDPATRTGAADRLPLSVSRRTASLVETPAELPVDPPMEAAAETTDPQAAPEPACSDTASDSPSETEATVETALPPEAPDTASDTPPDLDADPVSTDDAQVTAPATEEAPEDTAPAPETPEPPADPLLHWEEDALRDSPLTALPGAGIGLVWLLHANGITSLAELAEADADRLREGLGLVGQLVDLPGWIAFAAASLEAETSGRNGSDAA